MSSNRLFIYDPETNTAVCIAKGYSNGWRSGNAPKHVNDFYDAAIEYTGQIDKTRLLLKTEMDIPKDTKIYYEE